MHFYNIACYFFLLAYSLLLISGTWYPLTDWDWSAGGIDGFLAMDIFEYMSESNNLLNIIIYTPIGFFAAHLLPGPVVSRVVIVTLLGCLISIGLEFGQTFLPARSPSLTDITFNTTGTLLGALATVVFHRWLCQHRGNLWVSSAIESFNDRMAKIPQQGPERDES